jgi:Polyketide cyclase / dehydrase and lipid transport
MSDVAVSRHIAAEPAAVWRLVGDPTRMGEWSPEALAQEWLDGATGPAVGARFRGTNRIRWHRWSTVCTLVAWTPEREVGWDVSARGLAVARWSYRLVPDGAETLLVEEFTDRRGPLMKVIGLTVRGVSDVATHNRATMIVTLTRIAAAAEVQAGADTARQGPTTAPS